MNLEKCQLFTNLIDYLRHVICPKRLEISTAAVHAMRRLNYPNTVMELRPF